MSCSLTGRLTSSRLGRAMTLPESASRLMSSHWTEFWPAAKFFASSSMTRALDFLLDGDLIADINLVGRFVDLAAVYGDVTMTDDLAGLATREREAEAVGDVVEASLKLLKEEFAGDAGLVRGLLVVSAELSLEGEVDALGLLLLAQLQAVADDLLNLLGLAVLAGGEVALLDGAFLGEAFCSLEEELGSVAAAEASDGSCVTCHFYYS